MFTMTNPVRAYAWGSPTVIPELLGRPASGEPQAELWMGAHNGESSDVVIDGRQLRLVDALAEQPEAMLGVPVTERFGARLPFMLKLLAVDAPLSLQAHPTLAQAAEGFAAEQAAGVANDSPLRHYRDTNHKPEMVCALTPFEALVGFRPVADTVRLLDELAVAGLGPYRDELARDGAAGLFYVLEGLLGFVGVDRPHLVEDVREAAAKRHAEGSEFAAELDIVGRLAKAYPRDPGVVISLLMHPVRLAPGEAMFVPAGVLHAYLSGVAVEPQANCDNTLRGGLTEKHVDTEELLRILDATERPPYRVAPLVQPDGVELYLPPVPDFRLARVTAAAGTRGTLRGEGPSVLFCVEGVITARTASARAVVRSGGSVFVPAGQGPIEVTGEGVAFWATTNVDGLA